MLEILEGPAHVLDLRIWGTVNRQEIAAIGEEIERRLAGHDRLGLVLDMEDLQDMTADAVAEDLKLEFAMLDRLKQFPRIAVVSGREWVAAVMRMSRMLVPMIEMRVFTPDSAEEARAFAADLPAPEPERRSVTMIETGNPGLVAYEIDGPLGQEDVDRIMGPLEEAFAREGKIDLLVRIKHYGGFDPAILKHQSLFAMKFAALGHLRRYAIVGAREWMQGVAAMFGPLVPVEIRTFTLEEEDEAWAWLKA